MVLQERGVRVVSAEDIRKEILLILAKTPDLTAAEIYDACKLADTQQAVYAQINYLKRNGQIAFIVSDNGNLPYVYRLAKPLKELIEPPAQKPVQAPVSKAQENLQADGVHAQTVSAASPTVTAVSTTYQMVWGDNGVRHRLHLSLKHRTWYLSARRVVPITPELLRQMADLIEENT